MSSFVLSGETTADMSREHFEERCIPYVQYNFEVNGQVYKDDLGKTMPYDRFYELLSNGASTRTFQVNAEEFEEHFIPFLEQGKDILHVCLSSGITGVMNSAMMAKEKLEKKYPERKIVLVDSLAASSGFGMLLDSAADLRDEGKSIEEVAAWLEENKLRLNHWFFSSDLTFFIKGGRVTKTAGFVGQMLHICPLLHVDEQGKLIPKEKIRTKRKAIAALAEHMETLCDNGYDYNGRCYISNSGCPEDAEKVAEILREKFPHVKDGVRVFPIGTTIGSHTGPGTVALFFYGKPREAEA